VVRAGIYARISSDREADGLGVRRQLEDCEQLAQRRGWQVVDRYVDDDVSAYKGHKRAEYARLLDDLRAGALDGVVVWHLDRLHRQPKELEEFFEVCDAAGVRDLASVTGDTDLGSNDGRFTARILGAVARKESDDKSRRIRRKHLELAQAGQLSGGGSRPYGYEADRLTVRESEAVVVRECARRFLAGESIRSLCAELNARAVSTVSGGGWKTQTLRRLLHSARISGRREHHGEVLTDAAWPAIITPTDSAQIRARLDDPGRRTNKSARRYLLVRLLRCGECRSTLVSRPRGDGQRRYVCATGPNFGGCGHTVVAADPLEEFVVEAVLYRLDSPELAAGLAGGSEGPDAERFQSEVEQARAQLDELAETYGKRVISVSEWLAARRPIEQRLAAATKQLAKLSRSTVLDDYLGDAKGLRERWAGLDLTRQHAIVAAVLDHLVVGPARRGYNRFDPDRLRPVWRA